MIEKTITDAILANGSSLVKVIEVQQVINHSMSNYKAFFRWLYVVILRLMDEQIPPEIPKMTQQDLVYITEFLQNFDSIGNESNTQKNKFNLECLGQYLLDKPLTTLPNKDNNVWYSFLEENECLREHKSLIMYHDNKSLLQQQKLLISKIIEIFSEPKNLISTNFNLIHCVNCTKLEEICMTQINLGETNTMFAFLDEPKPSKGVNVLELIDTNIRFIHLHLSQFSNTSPSFKFLDVQFYTSNQLSVLLIDSVSSNAYIYQIPMLKIRENMIKINDVNEFVFDKTNSIDLCGISGIVTRQIEGISASTFAVSGSRHVSVVLSENRHKIQLFEMEADEEEEEEEVDTTVNTTQE